MINFPDPQCLKVFFFFPFKYSCKLTAGISINYIKRAKDSWIVFFWFIQLVRCTFSFFPFKYANWFELCFCFFFVFLFFIFKIFICLLYTCNASLHCKYTKVVNIIHIISLRKKKYQISSYILVIINLIIVIFNLYLYIELYIYILLFKEYMVF